MGINILSVSDALGVTSRGEPEISHAEARRSQGRMSVREAIMECRAAPMRIFEGDACHPINHAFSANYGN